MRAVLGRPDVLVEMPAPPGGDVRLVFLGDDGSGRVLEVMAVRIMDGLLVIHAMDIRSKWRRVYEEALRDQEEV